MKKTMDFDFTKNEFVFDNGDAVILTGISALKIWIKKILNTQLNRYEIYKGTSYGANIENLIVGKTYDIDFIKSELKREIENALLQNDDIESVSNFYIEKTGSQLIISFTLLTTYGTDTEVFTYDT